MQEQATQNSIVTSSRRFYTVAQKVFCCKCFDCCKDVEIMTSDTRKQRLQRMIRNYVIDHNQIVLYDPIKLMILIYLCEDIEIPKKHFEKCRINPNLGASTYRTDLQFYIPQLCNYIVFHSDLNYNYLLEGMEKACKLTFYFSHLYYYYIVSLEKIINKDQVQMLDKVNKYRRSFLDEMCKFYEGKNLSSIQLYGNLKTNVFPSEPDIGYFIKTYGTSEEDSITSQRTISPADITLPRYSSMINEQPEIFSFKSTLNFFDDLFFISEELKNHENKKTVLKNFLRDMNKRLPACVYVPFSKDFVRLSNILNIVAVESRVFSTKERAPFSICLEVFSPQEALEEAQQEKFWQKVETPFTFTRAFQSETNFQKRKMSSGRFGSRVGSFASQTFGYNRQRTLTDPYSDSICTEVMSERNCTQLNNKLLEFSNEMETQPRLNTNPKNSLQLKTYIDKSKANEVLANIFGESEEEFKERVRGKSIFGHFQTWNLVHIIVKTNDDLKQEQFALQLIQEFDYIFKMEKLPLTLTPYEVLSMGPDRGIIEIVNDSITLDSLKKKLRTQFPKTLSLKEFFELYFELNLNQAKQEFMKSLAAYSLVMYFLQAKDRHNGNIMLHKSGKLFHIDFGFFLSNMPGKGVELEKVCPFKLMSQQIDVLDGPDSYYFKKFRQYFFLGFKAARKHQNKILILVKMMYSSSGTTMPCFEKGESAILDIESRFNPPEISNDAQLNLHCQKLIDLSLDNWAARWYDRWQYWAQGIFY